MDFFELVKNLIVARRIAAESERLSSKKFWLGYQFGIYCYYDGKRHSEEYQRRLADAYQGEDFHGIGYRVGVGGMSVPGAAWYFNNLTTMDSHEERLSALNQGAATISPPALFHAEETPPA